MAELIFLFVGNYGRTLFHLFACDENVEYLEFDTLSDFVSQRSLESSLVDSCQWPMLIMTSPMRFSLF